MADEVKDLSENTEEEVVSETAVEAEEKAEEAVENTEKVSEDKADEEKKAEEKESRFCYRNNIYISASPCKRCGTFNERYSHGQGQDLHDNYLRRSSLRRYRRYQ